MALPKLSSAEERKIVKLINDWDTKLTWELIVGKIKAKYDIEITRQSLPTYVSIKTAYKDKKKELKIAPSEAVLEYLQKDIDMAKDNVSLNAEIAKLKDRADKQMAFIAEIAVVAKSNPAVMQVLEKVKRRIASSIQVVK